MNAREILGWNLRRLRVAKGLSQERLAFEADIDRSYVGRVERGTENVTIARLESFARVLEVTVAQLLTEPDAAEAAPRALPSGRKPKQRRATTRTDKQ
ncbi:MAG: helix-turn-helix domain-containing protein [Mesorhizobium sp.]|nr:helix-turn-helix domain-containing protein [Mesorhizobium sp.]